MKIFELKVGEIFIFNNKEFRIKKFRRTRKPRLGLVMQADCENLTDGGNACFLRNWEIKTIEDERKEEEQMHLYGKFS